MTDEYSEFLHRYYKEDIHALAEGYPDRKTLILDFINLDKYEGLGDKILDQPDLELEQFRRALLECDDLPYNIENTRVSITNLPAKYILPIHKIGMEQANKLISIEGRITRIAPKYQKLVEGAFKCQRCGHVTPVSQEEGKYTEPFECENDVCGRKGPFKLIHEESKYVDQQKIALQDLYESIKPGQPLREVIIVVKGADIITSVPGIGVQCVITGIVRLQQKKDSSEFHTFIEALHIQPKETEIDFSISETDIREFKTLAAEGDIIQTLVNSTAPEILGYADIKAALLCAIVSGSDNPQFREYMHLILCGDPGTGKSALLKSIRALVPRAQYSAGRGSSVAGLTVAVVKDELSGSGYTAQAGALVLADKGLMVLDEADKLETEDFQALNTALEESFIEIHKGGLNQRFNTRCSVIALCNPKGIRFDHYNDDPLTKQITIPADTSSRFDLIFKIVDTPDQKKDLAIAEHQARQWARYEGGSQDDQEECNRISQDKLSKYLQYAKTIKPRTNPETRKAIVDYYLTLRKPDGSGTIAATARQNNGLYRLTKSIAKLRLSDTCSEKDVEEAINIHKASLEALRDPTSGKIDVDILYGSSQSQRDRVRQIMQIIHDLQGSNGNKAFFDDIISIAASKRIKQEYVKNDLNQLKDKGDIIEVSNGFYRVVQ